MISFREAIREVGEWSEYNFGDQKGAQALAPFVGIVEERGEFLEAVTLDDLVDATVDQLVYLADVCYRAGLDIDPDWESSVFGTSDIHMGRLAHAILKNHQGIRKAEGDKWLEKARRAAAAVFCSILDAFYAEDLIEGSRSVEDIDIAEEFFNTWRNHVQPRDWVTNPDDANKVVQEAAEQLRNEQPLTD
jgi:hypothetical protein